MITISHLLLIFIMLASSVNSFTETIVIRRDLAATTPEEAYRNVYRAWNQNLGLWFVPPPFVLKTGDPRTGVGFVLMRVPPMGLKEGIVGHDRPSENSLRMTYKVLNPSAFTWPVQEHIGEIVVFSDENNGVDSKLEWTVRWTPLGSWIPFFPGLLKAITQFIIGSAADYVVELCNRSDDETQQVSTEL